MSASQGPHSLAFRVMRLCRPSFKIDHPLRLDALDHILGEDFFEDNACDFRSDLCYSFSGADGKRKPAMEDVGYWRRFELADLSDLIGFPGVLVLPQAFGAIYLGETFCSYISINNSSKYEVRDIIIKAEIQTERQRVLLLDTARSPVESIRSGGRYDFIVEHDVKELGPHTLVCTALYNDGDGERKYLPQFFKFAVANPLSVRTKVRSVKSTKVLPKIVLKYYSWIVFLPSAILKWLKRMKG
ncbi:Trafficking protein particle complex subunit 13 [Nymphaea thermarum]|nr:Trafficking protein particle complex subunit 13 [Nymphaea thermarum]